MVSATVRLTSLSGEEWQSVDILLQFDLEGGTYQFALKAREDAVARVRVGCISVIESYNDE